MTPRAWGMLSLLLSLMLCAAIFVADSWPVPAGYKVCLNLCTAADSLVPDSVTDVMAWAERGRQIEADVKAQVAAQRR